MTDNSLSHDPIAPDWAAINLQDTWADHLKLSSLAGWRELWRALRRKNRRPVSLPALPFDFTPPKYVLQEFHNLPNGNYSRRFSRGYIRGFDASMLGTLNAVRQWMAAELKDAEAVVDVGTAGGRTAAAIHAAGVARVWGVDPSPYLLKHAAETYPEVSFLPGLAEKLPFPDQRLGGVSVCFVLHEIPPRYIARAFAEFARVLKPGGKLVVAEPSAKQLEPFSWRLLCSRNGWRQIYFGRLARRAYEPFLPAWHKLDKASAAAAAGLELAAELPGMPVNRWVFIKST